MTVEEFGRLPEDSGPVSHELRRGKLVASARPMGKHTRIQKRLERLLEEAACGIGVAVMELPFRPVPEHEVRAADVAYLSTGRWDAIAADDHLLGAPDITIEVLSPSNTAAEIYEKENLCLANGALQFWVVDSDRRQVKVSTRDGRTITYQAGQTIPLPITGACGLPVDVIFG